MTSLAYRFAVNYVVYTMTHQVMLGRATGTLS